MTNVCVRKAYPVQIGTMTLYCENMKISAETAIYERSTVSGYPLITNKDRRVHKISFSGRVYNKNNSLSMVRFAGNFNSREGLDIIYRDLEFKGCIVTGFSAEDNGEDYVTITVNVSTQHAINTFKEETV